MSTEQTPDAAPSSGYSRAALRYVQSESETTETDQTTTRVRLISETREEIADPHEI